MIDEAKLLSITDAAFGNGDGLTLDDVEAVVRDYPYFTLPAAVYLARQAESADAKNAEADPARLARLRQAVALNCGDLANLYMLLDSDGAADVEFYPSERAEKPSTDNAIDTFLNTYGSTTPEEEEMLNRLIFNPTPDYAQMLACEEESNLPVAGEAPAGSDDDLLNSFIIKQKQHAGAIAESDSVPIDSADRRSDAPVQPATDNSLLSESLAKIFIKQGHYQRAFEIISQLNLNYPEKSVYFADQLRFLRKLINYQKHKDKTSK